MRIVPPIKYPAASDATQYRDANATTQQRGSWVPAEFFNSVNAELVAVIAAAGLTPASADLTQLLQAIQQLSTGAVSPSGAVMAFARSTAPAGWLNCDGAAISRTTFANLFSAIGVTYGAGDGSTTFNVPDLRGEFVRGWDDGRGVDADRAIGTAQADLLKSHTHRLRLGGAIQTGSWVLEGPRQDGTFEDDFGWGVEATGGAETRPRNVALLYCIKT
mgnify:CR=1 FL=1